MAASKLFSLQRIKQLAQYHYNIESKTNLLRIGGFLVAIILLLIIGQSLGRNYRSWENKNYFSIFIMFFFIGGVLNAANSFKWLRSKEARYAYLMIPATAMEKFIFEFVNRIVLFILLMPLAFWIIANTEGYLYHLFNPNLAHFQFSYMESLNKWELIKEGFWAKWLIVNGFLLLFTISFTGATYFKKSPFAKLLLSLAIILAVFFAYGLILFRAFSLNDYAPDNVLFINVREQGKLFLGMGLFMINIVCLTIGYFNVKEKEV